VKSVVTKILEWITPSKSAAKPAMACRVSDSLLALVSGIIYVKTNCFRYAFFLSGALLIVSIILSFTVRKPALKEAVPADTKN